MLSVRYEVDNIDIQFEDPEYFMLTDKLDDA